MRPALAVALLVLGLVASAGAAPAAGAPSTTRPSRSAGPTTLPVDKRKPYVHAPSGVAFPVNVGAFRRINVYRIDDAGRDITAGYADPSLKIAATVSVFPSRGVPAERHFPTIKRELLRLHPKATVTFDGAWTLRQGAREFTGHRAAYQYIGPLGGVEQDLTTEAYLLSLAANRGAPGAAEHFVNIRVTYPTADAKAARLRIEGFTEWLKLPDAPRPPPTTRPAMTRQARHAGAAREGAVATAAPPRIGMQRGQG
jgi:hypothetical protein